MPYMVENLIHFIKQLLHLVVILEIIWNDQQDYSQDLYITVELKLPKLQQIIIFIYLGY